MDHCDPIEILLDRLEEDLGLQLLACLLYTSRCV